jgi:hypothetical protein
VAANESDRGATGVGAVGCGIANTNSRVIVCHSPDTNHCPPGATAAKELFDISPDANRCR